MSDPLVDFIQQFEFPHEGTIFENDPDDDGNIGDGKTAGNFGTKFGIDAASHPGVNIVDLTADEALLIYQHEFFTSLAGSLKWPLAPAFFDIHVNNGEIRAIEILQTILGVDPDGKVGPITHGVIMVADPIATAMQLPSARDKVYERLAEAVPKDRKYLGGWENRDKDLLAWIKLHQI